MGGVLAHFARLVGLGLLLLLLLLERSCRIRASTFCAWICVVLLALDLVRLLAVRLHALGDRAQPLGVEDVVLVELLDRDHREAA